MNQIIKQYLAELDEKIKNAQENKALFKNSENGYSVYLAKELAFTEAKNLLLQKL